MKQVIVILFAGVVAGLSYGQSPDSVEMALVKMQAAVTNALPAEPARVREILPMLVGLSNQVAVLHATMGESIRSCRQYADQMKGQIQTVTENDPAIAEAYQKTYRDLVIKVEQSVKTQKRLETIADQIAVRINSIKATNHEQATPH